MDDTFDETNPACGVAACRTPGYWGTHGGTEKSSSLNVTQLTITLGGGVFNVCGESITNTFVDSNQSALEAICQSGGGRGQLARQLTALGLNCISTVNGPVNPLFPCDSVPQFKDVFNSCNALCAVNAPLGDCISQVDCLNNGGTPSGANCGPSQNNCHNNPLPFPDSPAGSPGACNAARKSACSIFSPVCPVV